MGTDPETHCQTLCIESKKDLRDPSNPSLQSSGSLSDEETERARVDEEQQETEISETTNQGT